MDDPGYSHTQKSPLCLLVYASAIALLVGAWFTHDEFPIALILGASGVSTLLLAMAFHHNLARFLENRSTEVCTAAEARSTHLAHAFPFVAHQLRFRRWLG